MATFSWIAWPEMFEAYRVLKQFQWRGWQFAPRPNNPCECGCEKCTGIVGSTCDCKESICRCACGISQALYGGDIWIVEAGHPRKEIMLIHRYVGGDGSLPPVEDLLKEEKFRRLTLEPGQALLEEVKKTEKPKRGRPSIVGTVRV